MIDTLDQNTQELQLPGLEEMLPLDDTEPRGMSDSDLLKAVEEELERALDFDDDEEDASDYFWARKPEAKGGAGRAKIVSTDIMDAVLATMAEIMPSIGSSQLGQFQPMGPEDEQQADAESRVVNHVILGVGGGFMAFTQAIQDALLRRVGGVKVYWDEHTEVAYESHKDVPLEAAVQLLQPKNQDEQVVIAGADFGVDLMGGVPMDGSGELLLKRTRKVRRPRVQAVPKDEMLVSPDHTSVDYDEARFVAHQRVVSASDMIALGIDRDLVESLPAYELESESKSRVSRKRSGDELEYETGDKSTKPILFTEAYYRVDRDGDGIAELRRIRLAGEAGSLKLIDDEPWDVQPFAVGAPYIAPFSSQGISLYDRLKFIQDVKTDLVRQVLDAGTRNLTQRIGVLERQVNYNDLLTSVMGGTVRMKTPGAVFPLPEVTLPQNSFSLLEMTDKMRREKGGAAIDTAYQAQQVAHDTAHGLERTMTAIEQVNAMVARNFAETLIAQTYKKMHRLLRKHWPGVIQSRIGGQWRQQVPAYWPERDEVAVTIGMTTGERMRMAQVLGGVIQQQQQAMQSGMDGVLIGLPQFYNALIDFGRASGLQAPEQYWIDPASQQSQQAAQQKQQAAQAQQQAAAQAAQQQLQAQGAMLGGIEKIKAEAAIAKAQLDAQVALDKADKDAEAKFADMRLKLVELNAKYDAEPVPDTMAQVEETNDKAAVASAARGYAAGRTGRVIQAAGADQGLEEDDEGPAHEQTEPAAERATEYGPGGTEEGEA